jgi:hypothetical protein
MKTFFSRIFEAVASFSFYQQVASIPFSKTIALYLTFLALFALIRSLTFFFTTLPLLVQQAEVTLQEVVKKYPSELSITWDGSTLRTSQPTVTIPYPTNWPTDTRYTPQTQYLAKIDTSSEELTADPQSLLTIGQKQLYIQTSEQTQETVSLAALFTQPVAITQESVTYVATQWQQIKQSFLTIIFLAAPLVIYIFLITQRLITAVIEATLFYIFKYILGSVWTYGTACKYTLFFCIPAEIIDFVAGLVYPNNTFSFFSLTLWVYFLAITFYPGFRRWQSLQRE